MRKLTVSDILPDYQEKVSKQSYSVKDTIDGVKIIDRPIFSTQDGMFEEIVRLSEDGSFPELPDFKPLQVNRSVLLPGSIKAWHLHYNQEDIWYVPPQDYLLLGLWDLRAESPTAGKSLKIAMGAGRSRLVYIPRGVAHGGANFSSEPSVVFYFVNQHFNPEMPDEERLEWDLLGDDFWVPEKG